MRVMTFSTKFPSYHPRKGEWTHFVPKIWKSINMLPVPHEYSDYYINYYTLKTDELVSYCKLKDVIPKGHTIRKGHRWKAGDWFHPVIWGDDINPKSGRSGPYQSKQIKIARITEPIEIKRVTIGTDTWNIL